MTNAQVVETSVTDNNNSPIQDYVHPDDQTQPTFDISEQRTVFSFSGHFLTVNTVVYVYRDKEPAQGRIRQRLQPLKKHDHVIGTVNTVKFRK